MSATTSAASETAETTETTTVADGGTTDSSGDSETTHATMTTSATSETGTTAVDTGTETGTTESIELSCDGSPAWTDPFEDGSLRLSGIETLGFDAGPSMYSWACVEDTARINVCEDTLIQLTEPVDTVIGGDGIGPLGDEMVTITIETPHPINLHVLVDVTGPPVDIWVDAPQACVTVTAKGRSDLGFGGTGAAGLVSTEGPLFLNGWTGTAMNRCPFEDEFNAGGGVIAPPPCPME